jgi:hypothetical protein
MTNMITVLKVERYEIEIIKNIICKIIFMGLQGLGDWV